MLPLGVDSSSPFTIVLKADFYIASEPFLHWKLLIPLHCKGNRAYTKTNFYFVVKLKIYPPSLCLGVDVSMCKISTLRRYLETSFLHDKFFSAFSH